MAVGDFTIAPGTLNPQITGAVAGALTSNLTPSRVAVTDGVGRLEASSAITNVELGYLNGLNESIKTSLDNRVNNADFRTEYRITEETGESPSGTWVNWFRIGEMMIKTRVQRGAGYVVYFDFDGSWNRRILWSDNHGGTGITDTGEMYWSAMASLRTINFFCARGVDDRYSGTLMIHSSSSGVGASTKTTIRCGINIHHNNLDGDLNWNGGSAGPD